MRGASAKSLTQLESAVEAAVSRGTDAGRLGTELFAVVAALDSAPTLRRVLTDPSSDDAAKDGLARRIFSDKVAAKTLDVVATAVIGRWSSARDLPDALERSGVTALVAGAAKDSALDDVEDELFRFGRVVMGDTELRSVLSDRSVPVPAKQVLIERLVGDKVRPATLALVLQAVVGRGQSFEQTMTTFGEFAAQRRERLVATVRVASPLEDDQKERLAAALAAQYGREVHVNALVDPAVIGGVSVQIGDEIIDGTMAGRLADTRRRIAGGSR
jgi:F-type H+-transporting ATPase subunit delta